MQHHEVWREARKFVEHFFNNVLTYNYLLLQETPQFIMSAGGLHCEFRVLILTYGKILEIGLAVVPFFIEIVSLLSASAQKKKVCLLNLGSLQREYIERRKIAELQESLSNV